MSIVKKENPDFWEQLDATSYYRPLSPKSVYQYFTGEVDDVFISRDHGKWWLKVDGVIGGEPYDTLEAAKAAGDATVEKSYKEMVATIRADLPLSDDEWTFKLEGEAIILTSAAKDSVSIVGTARKPRWWLSDGDEIVTKSNELRTVLTASNELIHSAPTPH